MRALKMRSAVASSQKVTTTTWEHHQIWSSYSYTKGCPRTQHGRTGVTWHVKQIGKGKKLSKWVPQELTENLKDRRFEASLLLFCAITMTGRLSLSLFGGLLPVWSSKLSESQQNHYWEVCSACWWNALKTATPLSWHRLPERARFFSAIVPDCMLHNHCFKSWKDRAMQFCLIWLIHLHWSCIVSCPVVSNSLRPHGLYSLWNSPGQNTGVGGCSLLSGNLPNPGIETRSPALRADSLPTELSGKPYSPDLSPTDYHFFKHLNNYLPGKCFHSQEEAKNAFQESVESRSLDFYTIGINKLVSCWQNCVDCSGPYFN